MGRNVSKQIGIVGLGLMGSALAQRLLDAGYAVLGFDIDRDKAGSIGKHRRHIRRLAARCRAALCVDLPRRFQHRAGRDGRRARPSASDRPELGQDCPLCQHLRSGPDRGARGAHRARGSAFARDTHFRHQRAGPARPWCRPDRRRRREARGGCGYPGRHLSFVLPHGPGWKCRPRQARHQSHPRPQSSGPCGRARLRRAHGARAAAFSRGRAASGILFASHGHEGTENGPRRFLAGRQGAPDAEGRPAHAGASPQAGAAPSARRAERRGPGSLRPQRRGRPGQQRRHLRNSPAHRARHDDGSRESASIHPVGRAVPPKPVSA